MYCVRNLQCHFVYILMSTCLDVYIFVVILIFKNLIQTASSLKFGVFGYEITNNLSYMISTVYRCVHNNHITQLMCYILLIIKHIIYHLFNVMLVHVSYMMFQYGLYRACIMDNL